MSPNDRSPSTEQNDPATRGLDLLDTGALVDVLVRSHARAVTAVEKASPQLRIAVERIATSLRAGGRLHYVGAGTSGRLGVLDASEAPPTFGTAPDTINAHIAGGAHALQGAIEGAEDDRAAAEVDLRGRVDKNDVVVGISASGTAPYVIAAIEHARSAGAFTVAVANTSGSALAHAADHAIELDTGPEPLAGSTRLIAGTAQKIVLNTLSTAAMVRLNRIYDNVMVDLVATNEKLRKRAVRLVRELTGIDDALARETLTAAEGSVKVAVAMVQRNLDAVQARGLLQANDGSLRRVLEAK